MENRIKLHEIISGLPEVLPEALERSIREADISVPAHTPYTTHAIVDSIRNFGKRTSVTGASSPREHHPLFSRARKEKVDPARFPGISSEDSAYIASRFNVAGAREASWENNTQLLTQIEEARGETGFPYAITPVFILNSDLPEAGANGNRALFLSEDIIRLLPRLPFKAMIGHEIEHMEENMQIAQAILEGRISFEEAQYSGDTFEKEHRADIRGAMTEGGSEAQIEALRLVDERLAEINDFRKASLAALRRGLREMVPRSYPYTMAWKKDLDDYEGMKPVFLRNLLKTREGDTRLPTEARIDHVRQKGREPTR